VPGYAAILLRRSFADLNLPDALIPLSHQWLHGTKAQWDGQQHRWAFPSGATLSFGYLDTENDKYRYQGAAFQFIGFDELTQFAETQYRYLFSRLRRAIGLPVPLRSRAATNPGGVGHEWVRQRFLSGSVQGRAFIASKLEDNPYLDQVAYEESLRNLDPVTRAQLRHGDWNIRPEGNLFKREWFTGQIVDAPPAGVKLVRYWDLAASKRQNAGDPDYASGALMGMKDGAYYLANMRRFRDTPQNVERMFRETVHADGRGIPVRIEQEPGSASILLIDNLARSLPAYEIRGVRSVDDKETRARPFSAACERRDVFLVAGPWVGDFLDELCAFPAVGHDDQVDAATGAYNELAGGFMPWESNEVESVLSYGDRD
jgi:predicted phage terminase large subunit-like protein